MGCSGRPNFPKIEAGGPTETAAKKRVTQAEEWFTTSLDDCRRKLNVIKIHTLCGHSIGGYLSAVRFHRRVSKLDQQLILNLTVLHSPTPFASLGKSASCCSFPQSVCPQRLGTPMSSTTMMSSLAPRLSTSKTSRLRLRLKSRWCRQAMCKRRESLRLLRLQSVHRHRDRLRARAVCQKEISSQGGLMRESEGQSHRR